MGCTLLAILLLQAHTFLVFIWMYYIPYLQIVSKKEMPAPCQVDPVFTQSGEASHTMFDVTFLVDVPALSLTTYIIKAVESSRVNPEYVKIFYMFSYSLSKCYNCLRPPWIKQMHVNGWILDCFPKNNWSCWTCMILIHAMIYMDNSTCRPSHHIFQALSVGPRDLNGG